MPEQQTYQDCYASYENGCLTIGNDCVERMYQIACDGIISTGIVNKETKYFWGRDAEQCHWKIYAEQTPAVELTADTVKDCLRTVITHKNRKNAVKTEIKIYPRLPFLTVSSRYYGEISLDDDVLDELVLPKHCHFRLKSVCLQDQTDCHDTLVSEREQLLWDGEEIISEGNLFLLTDYLAEEELLLIKDSPCPSSAIGAGGLKVTDRAGRIQLYGSGLFGAESGDSGCDGYGVTIGVGRPEELIPAFRKLYRRQCSFLNTQPSFIMSNTWGDRNQDGVLSEAFVCQEIETAAELGVDVVQLDDGWQQGITMNSCLGENGIWGGGYYAQKKEFWAVDPVKFPNGLLPLVEYGKRYGVELGLWFSPDSSEDYQNWKKDAEQLLAFYSDLHIRYFKLDGIDIISKKAEENYCRLLETVTKQSNGNVMFNQDITAERRLGYLYRREYGTLFVENRYTDWGTYYPHHTLKNLWQLSKYLPARKFQFELLNNKRNMAQYGNDPFAPAAYSMDYLFASVMPSNPLMWMELSGLGQEEKEALSGIIPVYKAHRALLDKADVIPVSRMPDGMQITGFQFAVTPDSGYLLLLREQSRYDEINLGLKLPPNAVLQTELLCSNAKNKVTLGRHPGTDGRYPVAMKAEKSYAFWQYQVK